MPLQVHGAVVQNSWPNAAICSDIKLVTKNFFQKQGNCLLPEIVSAFVVCIQDQLSPIGKQTLINSV